MANYVIETEKIFSLASKIRFDITDDIERGPSSVIVIFNNPNRDIAELYSKLIKLGSERFTIVLTEKSVKHFSTTKKNLENLMKHRKGLNFLRFCLQKNPVIILK